jgi:hypothetical protein
MGSGVVAGVHEYFGIHDVVGVSAVVMFLLLLVSLPFFFLTIFIKKGSNFFALSTLPM